MLIRFMTALFFAAFYPQAKAMATDIIQEESLTPEAGALDAEGAETEKAAEPVLTPEYELYSQGRHYLAQQRLDLAKNTFEEVVEKHGGTPEAILARFWLGEIKLEEKDYAGASLTFGQAYGALKKAKAAKDFSHERFQGEQDRLPEILAKLAYSLKMIKKRGDACLALGQLKKEFKTRPSNLQWYMDNLSKELKCR